MCVVCLLEDKDFHACPYGDVLAKITVSVLTKNVCSTFRMKIVYMDGHIVVVADYFGMEAGDGPLRCAHCARFPARVAILTSICGNAFLLRFCMLYRGEPLYIEVDSS